MFNRLQSFKPLNTLTATDLRGLDPDDVKFLVNAQAFGSEQQRLMFGAALNHLQGQQQRMDQAKTNVEKAKAAQELEAAKAQMRLIQDQLNDKRAQLLEEAKQGNRLSLEKYKNGLEVEKKLLEEKIWQEKNPHARQLADLELRKTAFELEQLKDGTKRQPGDLTEYQEWSIDRQMTQDEQEKMMALFNPETPPAQKQILARQLNPPESTVYIYYEPPKEPWLAPNTPESIQEIQLPIDLRTGKQLTIGDMLPELYEVNMKRRMQGVPEKTLKEAIDAIYALYGDVLKEQQNAQTPQATIQQNR